MQIALGMIVRNFTSEAVLEEFVANAEKYGHRVSCVIVVYSHACSEEAAKRLGERVSLRLLRHNSAMPAREYLSGMGVSGEAGEQLLYCDLLESCGLIPYGFNRNVVLIEALRTGADVLVFVDSDVRPVVLTKDPEDGRVREKEIDFFGSHLRSLAGGAAATSSDYSGYYILPPAFFPKMKELLRGLGKEEVFPFWESSRDHKCLITQDMYPDASGEGRAGDAGDKLLITQDMYPDASEEGCAGDAGDKCLITRGGNGHPSRGRLTKKLLGGNLGMRLTGDKDLPPFFSPYYWHGDTTYLARGEDTLMGEAVSLNLSCKDTGVHIFHDTFGSYPAVPDLKKDPLVQTRLFYACTGWIGRNVFLGWLRGEDRTEDMLQDLKEGSRELAGYTGNDRYLALPEILESAAGCLPDMIRQYEQTRKAWDEFMRKRRSL